MGSVCGKKSNPPVAETEMKKKSNESNDSKVVATNDNNSSKGHITFEHQVYDNDISNSLKFRLLDMEAF
jgi:hypothetical protein